MERRRARDEARLKELEDDVTRLEAALRDGELALADPEVYRDGERARAAAGRRDAMRKDLEGRTREWEELSLMLETSGVSGATA